MRKPILAAFIILAACSGLSREQRIADRLERAGIKPRLARCMAPKLAHDLSDDELRTLAEAARASDGDGGGMGRKAVLRRVDAIGDPHISEVVARAGIGCAILG